MVFDTTKIRSRQEILDEWDTALDNLRNVPRDGTGFTDDPTSGEWYFWMHICKACDREMRHLNRLSAQI